MLSDKNLVAQKKQPVFSKEDPLRKKQMDKAVSEKADHNFLYVDAEDAVEGLKDSRKTKSNTPQVLESSVNRRSFLKIFGMTGAASAAACVRRPTEKAIPYVNQPTDHVSGVAVHYASTCSQCSSGCGIVVKTKEGRPVKLEGHPDHPINKGALCAFGQAQIQGLYHPERLKEPMQKDSSGSYSETTWDDSFARIASAVKNANGQVGIFTSGSSGHRNDFLKQFLKKLGASEKNLYTWESNYLSTSMAEAYRLAYGEAFCPDVNLNETKYLIGIGSDFQDQGISPVYFSRAFSKFHDFKRRSKSFFIQFESNFTLTGTQADDRYPVKAGSEFLVAVSLLDQLSKIIVDQKPRLKTMIDEVLSLYSDELSEVEKHTGVSEKEYKDIAEKIYKDPSVIFVGGSGSQDEHQTRLQLVGILMNELLGAYKKILRKEQGVFTSSGDGKSLARFKKDAKNLKVLFVIDSDPVHTLPESWKISETLESIPDVVSMQAFPNEVDQIADHLLPCHHGLESWGDEQPVKGFWSIRQPAVRPLTNSRQAEDALLWILATAKKNLPYEDYHAYLEKHWLKLRSKLGFTYSEKNFTKALVRKGFILKAEKQKNSELKNISPKLKGWKAPVEGFKLIAPLDHRLSDGKGAHLPVLQEIGDGLTTIAWDSWCSINPRTMKKLGLERHQMVEIEGPGGKFEVAVYPLPGVHESSLVVHRGNGSKNKRSTVSYENGVNPLVAFAQEVDPLTSLPQTSNVPVSIKPLDKHHRLAVMQKKNDLDGRKDILKKYLLEEAKKLSLQDLDDVPDVFPKLEDAEYRWGMAIDLDRCNGCGACMTACNIENNVPQVGQKEIVMGREMHWLRMDRYFSGDVDKPNVSFQPVMCQHCNHAPCEAVCPVYATAHDPEGLNAMTYNRCVGTRYCANACPYKVRRFNWWTYKWSEMGDKQFQRNPRAMNPDVTVRTRGVMEKCSMCVGRIREAKHEAKKEGRKVKDGEIKTACQQTCATDCITFGRLDDLNSRVSRARRNGRSFLMLGGEPRHHHYGLKTLPNVSYLAKVVTPGSREEKEILKTKKKKYGDSHGGSSEHH
ncbi:MAG: hypothetical protein CMP11_08995 [Zetaproteobacteria bacterium]|nr:hypothetical protein [Pseudobdellovibrionaceae bacterium]